VIFMLKTIQKGTVRKSGGRFAIVASRFNARYVDSMLRAARKVLSRACAETIDVFRVPGAFEIPVVASRLAHLPPPGYSAVICLGVVLRGETAHAQQIGDAVSLTLAQLQTSTQVPVIHGVYLFDNVQQAQKRCLDPQRNRGVELALTAVDMAALIRRLPAPSRGPQVPAA
jgi:6,7-dimethyl-8-ribityllumazine synthase